MRAWIDLCEGRDAPLFHFTSKHALEKILQADRLGEDGGTVSLTRDQNLPFRSGSPVVLILVQTLLSHRYRLTPSFGDSAGTKLITKSQDESEERATGPIAPLHRYLRAIVVDAEIMAEIEQLRRIKTIPEEEQDAYHRAVLRYAHLPNAILAYAEQHGTSVQTRDTSDKIWSRRDNRNDKI